MHFPTLHLFRKTLAQFVTGWDSDITLILWLKIHAVAFSLLSDMLARWAVA